MTGRTAPCWRHALEEMFVSEPAGAEGAAFNATVKIEENEPVEETEGTDDGLVR